MLLSIRIIPRSPRSAITGMRGEAVLIRLAAPPVDGAANDALIQFLSKTFQRPRRDIAIVSGEKSRDKRVSIEGISEAEIRTRLAAILNAER
ncbi:MAG TPA: DUF167 domain-containing protein [Vicinamibacterales bacterium]|nr:DUF167 domain-containing protein [Vicinamibacterales bacterium]